MSIVKKLLFIQFGVLLGGTLFAWYQWYQEYFGNCDTCSSAEGELISKCFLGAVFFSAAFILNLAMIYKNRK